MININTRIITTTKEEQMQTMVVDILNMASRVMANSNKEEVTMRVTTSRAVITNNIVSPPSIKLQNFQSTVLEILCTKFKDWTCSR